MFPYLYEADKILLIIRSTTAKSRKFPSKVQPVEFVCSIATKFYLQKINRKIKTSKYIIKKKGNQIN